MAKLLAALAAVAALFGLVGPAHAVDNSADTSPNRGEARPLPDRLSGEWQFVNSATLGTFTGSMELHDISQRGETVTGRVAFGGGRQCRAPRPVPFVGTYHDGRLNLETTERVSTCGFLKLELSQEGRRFTGSYDFTLNPATGTRTVQLAPAD